MRNIVSDWSVVLLDSPKSAGGRADFLLYQSILIGYQDLAFSQSPLM